MTNKRLSQYVDHLFAGRRKTVDIQEAQEEIRTNLEEKYSDYIAQGLSADEAYGQSIKHFTSIDFLFHDRMQIYHNRFLAALGESALLYMVVIWILSLPSRLLFINFLNNLLLAGVILIGIVYYVLKGRAKGPAGEATLWVSREALAAWQKKIWLLWVLFVIVCLANVIAIRFGSNLWFQRPIYISGPYQYAQLAYSLFSPLLSVVVPLLLSKAVRLISYYEVEKGQ